MIAGWITLCGVTPHNTWRAFQYRLYYSLSSMYIPSCTRECSLLVEFLRTHETTINDKDSLYITLLHIADTASNKDIGIIFLLQLQLLNAFTEEEVILCTSFPHQYRLSVRLDNVVLSIEVSFKAKLFSVTGGGILQMERMTINSSVLNTTTTSPHIFSNGPTLICSYIQTIRDL